MLLALHIIHIILPMLALGSLIIGLWNNRIYCVIASLWLSLIALVIHYQASGGEILGSYFNYFNAFFYTLNLFILCIALSRVIYHLTDGNSLLRHLNTIILLFIVVSCSLLTINLWINADFIEHRLHGTPVMQVTLAKKTDYCSYNYLFYTMTPAGTVAYLCPNYYGLIPSLGTLDVEPDFIKMQASAAVSS